MNGVRPTFVLVPRGNGDSIFPFGATSRPRSCFFFFFSMSIFFMANSYQRFQEGFLRWWWWLLAAPLPGVHYSRAHHEYVRSPIFIPSSPFIPVAHAFTNMHVHTQTRRRTAQWQGLLLPQTMEYHICLFTPRFLSLNSINIYIAAEGVGSPSCSGGKLSLDENELQLSLPRHRLVCLYLHYPAIPQLPLPRLGVFFFFLTSYHHLLQLASYVTLYAFISLQGKLIALEKKMQLETFPDWTA